jgi:hypothetical protein
MEAHHLAWFALGQWAMLVGATLFAGAVLRWRDRGRRRDQRRTEARLHEEGKQRLLRARDKVKAELRTNGAASSEHTRGTLPERKP